MYQKLLNKIMRYILFFTGSEKEIKIPLVEVENEESGSHKEGDKEQMVVRVV